MLKLCCNNLELSLKQKRFNQSLMAASCAALCTTFLTAPECLIAVKRKRTLFSARSPLAPRNRPYSSSNIKAARLPARPRPVEQSGLLRRRPTSAKAHVPLIFHSADSFLSRHSRKRSGSIRLVGLSSSAFSWRAGKSHWHETLQRSARMHPQTSQKKRLLVCTFRV